MSSILTNNSALVALQTLKSINAGMGKVQSEISTGLRVATAKDNSSSWAIAATMSSDIGSFKKVSEGLASSSAMVGVARAAAEQVTDILKQVQEKVVQAQDPSADTAKLGTEVTEMLGTIASIATSAQFNGVNLVTTLSTAATVVVAVKRDAAGALTREAITVAAADLEGQGVALIAAIDTEAALQEIDGRLDIAIAAAANFGAKQMRIDAQNDFLGKQMDSLKVGVGALVDADMEEASARLQALQVQQQLGIQSLSIANQAPQSVLSLFR